MILATLIMIAKIWKKILCYLLSTYCITQVSSHIIYYSEESYDVIFLPVLQIKKPELRDKEFPQVTQYENGELLVLTCNF